MVCCVCCFFFFFNDTATTEIYTLSLHDALPICSSREGAVTRPHDGARGAPARRLDIDQGVWSSSAPVPDERVISIDRKSTRLNSSHANISYAVFCLKKKKNYLAEYEHATYSFYG